MGNGYPALPYISVSNQSCPSQQGTPQGTPVPTAALTNTSSQTPPFVSIQQIQQSLSVPHPSMLPPPPSPHSLNPVHVFDELDSRTLARPGHQGRSGFGECAGCFPKCNFNETISVKNDCRNYRAHSETTRNTTP